MLEIGLIVWRLFQKWSAELNRNGDTVVLRADNKAKFPRTRSRRETKHNEGEMFPTDVISSAEPPVDDEMPKNYFRVVLSLLVIFQNSPQGNKAASLWLPGPSLSKTHSSIKREVSCCWSWSPFTSADSALQSRGQSRRGGQGGGRGVISTQSISGRWRWPATFSYLTR